MSTTSPWKRPDEIMQLHRLKKRKKALQKRMSQVSVSGETDSTSSGSNIDLNFSNLTGGDKRKNPFTKQSKEEKRCKPDETSLALDESSDKTLFALLNMSKTKPHQSDEHATQKLSTFSNLLQKYTQENYVESEHEVKHKYLPLDWALKTKVRLMSPKPFAWDLKLKASEEASGITGFVRCLDTDSPNSLDTSHHARFHQHCQYWQHPHLPWINLFPRSSGKVTATSVLATNENVTSALHREWTESFRSLFQLVRARQCPYFYLCANTFTCLFRSAGLCGVTETCALIAPTTRGFRQTLKQEDVEFTMPLRPRKSSHSDSREEDRPKNSSYDSCYDTMDDDRDSQQTEKKQDSQHTNGKLDSQNADENLDDEGSGEDDDYESDRFLSRLGFETEQIRRINSSQARLNQATESAVDSAVESLVLVRGVDAQALFNFLLNCKSITSPTGPLGGVPPTLLAPTAFHGGTLQTLKVRDSTIISEDKKYYSIELRGPMLPTTLHSLLAHIRSTTTHFSATFANLKTTEAFSAAAKAIAAGELSKENEATSVPQAFNRENLSDCGLNKSILQHFCSANPDLVKTIDSLKYSSEDDAFVWL